MKLADIASTLNSRLENGSPDLEITGVAGIEDAGAGQITFLANHKYASAARTTKASADNFFAHAHAVVREHCRIGNNVILQNGVIVGGDGFGFAKDDSGRWHKIVQSGPAVIEDDVEIQANACIDRASVGETHIARGAKI